MNQKRKTVQLVTMIQQQGRKLVSNVEDTCSKCQVVLVEGDNWLPCNKKNNQYICRGCKSDYLRNWRKGNPGAYKEWKYGITQDDYDALLILQENKCAICSTTEPGGRRNNWHIDHDHVSGKVRGLLCWLCNSGLGQFKDNERSLRKAANYVEKFKEDSCT